MLELINMKQNNKFYCDIVTFARPISVIFIKFLSLMISLSRVALSILNERHRSKKRIAESSPKLGYTC